jgi:hypothetical protein
MPFSQNSYNECMCGCEIALEKTDDYLNVVEIFRTTSHVNSVVEMRVYKPSLSISCILSSIQHNRLRIP